MGMGLGKLMRAAERTPRKPDTKSRKMLNVIRYVSNQDPTKKATLSTSKPGTTK